MSGAHPRFLLAPSKQRWCQSDRLTPRIPFEMYGSMANWKLLVGLTLLAHVAAAEATTWENAVPISVTVNGHAFHDAKVVSDGCTLGHELRFEAPATGYADPKNAVRNYHLFQARVTYAKGQKITTRVFGNSGPGERVYRFSEDTTAAGCWGKSPNKIVKLDVIGCRGRVCDLGQFD
jgi:hypothetical protein